MSEKGIAYARALTMFIKHQRQTWDVHQRDKALSTHFPPLPGDTTPPNPEYNHGDPDDSEAPKRYVMFRRFFLLWIICRVGEHVFGAETVFILRRAVSLLSTLPRTTNTDSQIVLASAYGRPCSSGASRQPNSLTKTIMTPNNSRCLTS